MILNLVEKIMDLIFRIIRGIVIIILLLGAIGAVVKVLDLITQVHGSLNPFQYWSN